MMAAPERIAGGLVGFLWTQAALVAPVIALLRAGLDSHDPWWSLAMTGLAALAVAILFPAKVMRVAFGLSNMGAAIAIALTGSVVSYLVDLFIAKVWI
jgi:hypothetical protein